MKTPERLEAAAVALVAALAVAPGCAEKMSESDALIGALNGTAGHSEKVLKPAMTPDAGHLDQTTTMIKASLDEIAAAQADLSAIKNIVRARLGLGVMSNYDGCAPQPFDSHFCISCAAGREGMTRVATRHQAEGDAVEMLRKEVPEMKNGEWRVFLNGEGNETDGAVRCAKALYTGPIDRSSRKVPRNVEEVTEATEGLGSTTRAPATMNEASDAAADLFGNCDAAGKNCVDSRIKVPSKGSNAEEAMDAIFGAALNRGALLQSLDTKPLPPDGYSGGTSVGK